jgi:hypothetical protein
LCLISGEPQPLRISVRGSMLIDAPESRWVLTFSPALIPAHCPSFTNDATARALSGRVLCSASTSAAVIPTIAVIIPTIAPIGIDPNPARADFDALGLRGGASNNQWRSRK